jgi:hypothetical protein
MPLLNESDADWDNADFSFAMMLETSESIAVEAASDVRRKDRRVYMNYSSFILNRSIGDWNCENLVGHM